MKKFYKLVTTNKTPGGLYEIQLDGKPVKTPSKAPLSAPNKALAEAIMAEWAAQEDTIKPETMPLTQILSTKIDRVRTERDAMTAMLMKYLDTDLICYFTDDPAEIAKRQDEAWAPWLDWFEEEFGAKLETTTGLSALTQPEAARTNVLAHIQNLDEDHFTALQLVVPLAGSLVLGLAFTAQALDKKTLFSAIRVEENFKDELYNAKKYGIDPAQESKDNAARADLAAAQLFIELL